MTVTEVRRACAAAAEALSAQVDDAAAIDAAIGALHDAIDGKLLCSVFVREHERLWLTAQRGYRIVPDGLPIGRGIVSRAVRTGETQYVPVAPSDPDYEQGATGIVSEIATVVGSARPATGALNVESRVALPAGAVRPLEAFARRLAPRLEAIRHSDALDLSALARLFVHSSSLQEPSDIADLAARSLARILDLDGAQVHLGKQGRRRAAAGSWQAHHGLPLLDVATVEEIGRVADRDVVCDVIEVEERGLGRAVPDAGGIAWLPLRANGTEIGVLLGLRRERIAFEHGRVEAAALLAAHIAASLDAAVALTRERRAAVTDPLTGVLNRRGLDDRIEEKLAEVAAGTARFALVMLDCDDFKAVNDAGGHELGDRVLAHIGAFLRGNKRAWDVAARLGGDEFVVLLPGATPRQASLASERMRRSLAESLARAGHRLTVSVGVAACPDDGVTGIDLLRAADRALYAAKEAEKRRAATAGPTNVVELPMPGNALFDAPIPRVVARLTESAGALDAPEGSAEMLGALCRELCSLLGGAAAIASMLEGSVLHEAARHGEAGIPVDPGHAYLLDDYPVTREVLESRVPRTVSLGDDRPDASEAFVLRELGMQTVLLLPLVAGGVTRGLVEVFDARPRRFGADDLGVAEFLVGHAGRLLQSFEDAVSMERFYSETLASITNALEAKDLTTSRHTQDVQRLAGELGRRLGLDGQELRTLELGALLHDIGKLRVPESILCKAGPLDEDEWRVIMTHPEAGEEILAPITPLRDVLPIVRSHHERWDGRGYPDRIAGEEIPLGARIIAVCDAWRAMNEPRPYRAPLSHEAALRELRAHAGTQFDPVIVERLVELVGEQPEGDAFLRPPGA